MQTNPAKSFALWSARANKPILKTFGCFKPISRVYGNRVSYRSGSRLLDTCRAKISDERAIVKRFKQKNRPATKKLEQKCAANSVRQAYFQRMVRKLHLVFDMKIINLARVELLQKHPAFKNQWVTDNVYMNSAVIYELTEVSLVEAIARGISRRVKSIIKAPNTKEQYCTESVEALRAKFKEALA